MKYLIKFFNPHRFRDLFFNVIVFFIGFFLVLLSIQLTFNIVEFSVTFSLYATYFTFFVAIYMFCSYIYNLFKK